MDGAHGDLFVQSPGAVAACRIVASSGGLTAAGAIFSVDLVTKTYFY